MFRDDRDALAARVESLEQQLKEAKEELKETKEELKEAKEPKPEPKPPPKIAQEPTYKYNAPNLRRGSFPTSWHIKNAIGYIALAIVPLTALYLLIDWLSRPSKKYLTLTWEAKVHRKEWPYPDFNSKLPMPCQIALDFVYHADLVEEFPDSKHETILDLAAWRISCSGTLISSETFGAEDNHYFYFKEETQRQTTPRRLS